MARDGYTSLRKVLKQAELRASEGKGKERHAVKGVSFEHQPICAEAREMGIAPNVYQIRKKALEANRFTKLYYEKGHRSTPGAGDLRKAALNELLDIIVYAAATVLVLEEEINEQETN